LAALLQKTARYEEEDCLEDDVSEVTDTNLQFETKFREEQDVDNNLAYYQEEMNKMITEEQINFFEEKKLNRHNQALFD